MARKWQLLDKKIPADEDELGKLLLRNRGMRSKKEIEEFLLPTHPSKLKPDDVGLRLVAVKKAVSLINSHIKKRHQIAIYGDYDVDGICSTAILWERIYSIYKNVFPHIPHRRTEGYGLSKLGIDHCLGKGTKLIIAVDNGIVANKLVSYCRDKGCDIIIIDHHEKGLELPRANVVLHSERTCAAGLAYVFSRYIKTNTDFEDQLGLVAIAVICDMVSLLGVNRSFAKSGLEELRVTKRPGLKALFEEAAIDPAGIGVYEVGFVIGPRLNAMGRLEHAIESLRLICTKDKGRARELAWQLGQTNHSRQVLTEEAVTKALGWIEQTYGDKLPKLLVVDHAEYSEGVIGLIAAKLVEKYYRPAIAIYRGVEESKASARSINGFDITAHIRRMTMGRLSSVGGHAMAAGFTVETDKIEEIRDLLTKNVPIADILLDRVIKVDCQLLLGQISAELWNKISKFQPFGLGNPEPIFLCTELSIVDSRLVGREGKHLKLILSPKVAGKRNLIEAIGFGLGEKLSELAPGTVVDVIFNLINNTFREKSDLQLKIRDIKAHGKL